MNDGVCVDGINSYTCDCTHGFIGENCSISTYFSSAMKKFKAIEVRLQYKPNILYNFKFQKILMIAWKILATMVEHVQMESPTTLALAPLVSLEVTASRVCIDIGLNYNEPNST